MTAATDSYTVTRRRIPEIGGGGRLGRHVNHDSRSLAYRPARAASPVSVAWQRYIPVLDQGQLGSCTGNASVGQLGTGPAYEALSAAQQSALNEAEAVKVYSLATQLDNVKGTYPPNDTGSDGLSAAKACQQLGLIAGYTHATSTDEMVAALQTSAGMVGTNWTTHMDSPAASGVISKPTGGTVRGGHEYEVAEVDLEAGLFWFWNSWGTSFGLSGKFGMQIEDFADLLAQDGDATFFVPLSQPAPTPTPVPVSSVTRKFSSDDASFMDEWASLRHTNPNNVHAAGIWKASE